MPGKLLRKLTAVTNAEDLEGIKEELELREIHVSFEVHIGPEVDLFRLFVPSKDLKLARHLVYERYLRMHPEYSTEALAARAEEILGLQKEITAMFELPVKAGKPS